MKTQAFILFIPLAVFFTETVSIFPCWDGSDNKVVKANTCSSQKAATTCNRKTSEKQCSPQKAKGECSRKSSPKSCQSTGTCDKSSSGKDCDDNPDCSTCPVCYIFIAQQPFEWNPEEFYSDKTYNLEHKGHISDYPRSVWKPPDGFVS